MAKPIEQSIRLLLQQASSEKWLSSRKNDAKSRVPMATPPASLNMSR
jgi:hypothetical protein